MVITGAHVPGGNGNRAGKEIVDQTLRYLKGKLEKAVDSIQTETMNEKKTIPLSKCLEGVPEIRSCTANAQYLLQPFHELSQAAIVFRL